MDKRTRFKSGLSFGIAMAIFFVLQNLFKHYPPTAKDVFVSIVSGIIGGAISGLLFGWLIGKFVKSRLVTETTKIDVEPNESVLFETPANHFKGMEAVGGKLYLTNKRLVFKSHSLNIQNHQLSLNLFTIAKVDRYKTLGIVNNGLTVITTHNTIEKFVVQQRDEWMKYLTEKGVLPQVHL